MFGSVDIFVRMTGACLLAQPASLGSAAQCAKRFISGAFISLTSKFSSPARHIFPFGQMLFVTHQDVQGTLQQSLAELSTSCIRGLTSKIELTAVGFSHETSMMLG